MGICKRGKDDQAEEDNFDDDENMSDSDSSEDYVDITQTISEANVESDSESEEKDEEDEDEVIKAIRRENEKKNNHPPTIVCEDFVVDICFHPHEDLLAVANIVGDIVLYQYSKEECTTKSTIEMHTKACRAVEFSQDGKLMYSTAKDKSIMITDVQSEALKLFYENVHDVPPYCLTVIDENLFATGDDDGVVKLWDLRIKDQSIFSLKKNEDYISDILSSENKKHLLCSSGDGSLTTIDLENRRFLMQSEGYDEELTCLGTFRDGTKLLTGSSKGKLILFNWNEFGLHSDMFPGPKSAINCLIPITENIVITGCEDGNLRATHLFPHRHLGIAGQHEMAIENVDICKDGEFIASSGHNDEIRFWNIEYFEDFESVSRKHNKHQKKREMEHNLPSSKRKNVAEFFSDLS